MMWVLIRIYSCTNECTSGAKRCYGTTNIQQTCGNYDSDSCLEWPATSTGSGNSVCPVGTGCFNGICET